MMVFCLVVNPGQTIQGIHAILAMGVRGLLAARKGSAQHPKFPPGLEGIVETKSLELRNAHRYPSCVGPTSFGSQGFSGRGSRSSSSNRRSGRLKAILHHPIQDYARQDFSTFMTIQKSKF